MGLTVWYSPDGIANVLSLSKLVKLKKAEITYNAEENSFESTRPGSSKKVSFPCNKQGLYSWKADSSAKYTDTVLVNTVKKNMLKYTRSQVKRATEARRLQ